MAYEALTALDLPIIRFLNSFANVHGFVDWTLVFVSQNTLMKGGMFMLLTWWLWFRIVPNQRQLREKLIASSIAVVVAMATSRFLTWALPMRPRPMHNQEFGLTMPQGLNPETLEGMSSFPSDHAALFFTLAACLWFISHRLGIAAVVYTSLIIAFPRIYLGLHHPSDILAGACIGVIVAVAAHRSQLARQVSAPILRWTEAHPASFYAAFFLFTYQIADMFDATRALGSYALFAARAVAGWLS